MAKPFNTTSKAEHPAYKAGEAAAVLGLPKATVLAWCFGQGYVRKDGATKRFKPLVAPADKASRYLSFVNLCELHVLAVIRRHHGIQMHVVRQSLDYVEKELATKRPLVAQEFLTNGVDLFVERASQLITVSKKGQMALKGGFAQALTRIERTASGPIRLFPYTRISQNVVDQPRAVAVDPRIAFGRPVLLKAGVITEVIVERFLAGDSIAEMAGDFRVEASDIDEALRFEHRRAA